jgi:hypothetical protein
MLRALSSQLDAKHKIFNKGQTVVDLVSYFPKALYRLLFDRRTGLCSRQLVSGKSLQLTLSCKL